MAKKDRVQIETTPTPVQDFTIEEPFYEAEAYTTPQSDPGADVTVCKTVGAGGPVPIVAPKHNTIQLQPIIVPLAVVPYMTQDSSVLRTDGRAAAAQSAHSRETAEAAEFRTVETEKAKKRTRAGARLFAFLSLLLALLTTLPFILAYFKVEISGVKFTEFNSILLIEGWVNKSIEFSFRPITYILLVAFMAMSMLSALFTLIGFIFGKYPKPWLSIFEFAGLACFVAILIKDLVEKQFVLENRIIFIVVLALTALAFILSILFSVLINRRQDRVEEMESEI